MVNGVKTILGIDPGLLRTGWGIVSCDERFNISLVGCGIITTRSCDDLEQRINILTSRVGELIDIYSPEEVSMEEVFINMNAKTSEKLIMARTAIFTSLAARGFKIHGYKPNKVKKAVTGSGHAQKTTVQVMVENIVQCSTGRYKLDTVDAIAVAICHCYNGLRFM